MPKQHPAMGTCAICGKSEIRNKLHAGASIRHNIFHLIALDYPGFSEASYICHDDLATYRGRYIQSLLVSEKGELTTLETGVIESLRNNEIFTHNAQLAFEEKLTIGQRIADKIASFGGSWPFLISFFVFLAIWIIVNVVNITRPFDPYPFILLNLILSCLASIQAPVIMMSQNRQAAKDRTMSEHEYQINLKAELEIRNLHEKMDHLLMQQWERLVEIQQVQIEMLEEMGSTNRLKKE